MAVSVLSQASAFNPGADLWILPDVAHSSWSTKIDWYLNFQICRSERHETRALAPKVDHILEETGLERQKVRVNRGGPLLIASHDLLPNRWVAVIPFSGDLNAWLAQVAKIWEALKSPSYRVFLPPGQSTGQYANLWQKSQKFEDYSLVLD